MKKTGIAVMLAGMLLFARAARGQVVSVNDDQWPRSARSGETTFKVYQPQLDSWDGYTLRAHSAIGVQTGGNEAAVSYGVATFTAKTIVDKAARLAHFENLRVEAVRFPSEPDRERAYLVALSSVISSQLDGMALDRLEADLAIAGEQKKGQAQRLRNDPPRIIFSAVPAVLVTINGDPVLTPVEGTGLSRVINTQALLLRSGAKYYVHVFDGYLESGSITGPWRVAALPPDGAQQAEQLAAAQPGIDLLEGEPDPKTGLKPSLRRGRATEVYVSTIPAELIVTAGEANYVPIEGTNLLYIANTSANVFKDLDDQQSYVLLSGRWFRASDTRGQWEYVPAARLPADFAAIPDNSPKENVKASVPGTPQAQEAAIANSVPTTAKVERTAAVIPLQVDGEPQLRAIEGTPLQYVFNASLPVIRIDARTWYAVYNGVWYAAANYGGPWTVAATVPAVIYSIPPSSPLYYVTYVRIYDTTPQYVYVGYTPGYYGTALSPDGTVVYGTGYLYPSYASRSAWYSSFETYGYGCDMRWTPWYGWSFGFGFGWWYPDYWVYPPPPFWGPFFFERHRFHHHFRSWSATTSANVYRHALPPSMQSLHFGQAYNSRTGARIAGHTSAIANVFGGTAAPAPVLRHAKPALPQGGQARPQTVPHARPPGIGTVPGNLYGTRQGNVYYYEQEANRWRHLNPLQRQAVPPAVSPAPGNLEQERSAREQGNTRAHTFQPYEQQGGASTTEPGPSPGTVPHLRGQQGNKQTHE